ncbi:MAG TPA: response regulator, partial [Pseudobdellovibrionaceae bacterium]|nr:response regulator [Pseudobdellovibrionaceae bacterium]
MQDIKILVVDDEPEIREIILLFLGFQYQGEFVEAENALDAIQKIKEQGPFQLIVSDFNMPKANGLVLYQYLKNNHMETPFTLVTSDQLEDHPEFMNQPLTNYIQKPFNEETFLKEINSLLDLVGTEFKRDHEYIPISIHTLKRIKNINCPIYIRL